MKCRLPSRITKGLGLLIALPSVAIVSSAENKRILFYDPPKALEYAKKWCTGGNECTSGSKGQYRTDNNTDCSHFIAHVLFAGGVKVAGKGAACDKGLAIRAIDLGEWFDQMVVTSANLRKVPGWQETAEGDYAFSQEFIFRPWLLRVGENYRHAMLLAEKATEKSAKVYSHTSDKCGTPTAHFETVNGTYFRIGPSPLEGLWVSTDQDGRFHLKVAGRNVEWTEKRKPGDGNTFMQKAVFEENDRWEYQLTRANDADVLKNLGFADAALRKAILEANPEPSTLSITWDGNKCAGLWRGLAVRKQPNGKFSSILQPSASAGTTFGFRKL